MFTYKVKRIKYGSCENAKVMIYSAKDTLEMAEGLKSLTQHNHKFRDYDLFVGNHYGDWAGAQTRAEAWDMLRHGTNKKGLINEVKSYITDTNASYKVKKYRDVTYRPFGCAVCVPRMLSGNPNCMLLPVKTAVKTRNIKLLIDSGVSGGFSSDEYRRVGSVLGRAIADIERAGYRIRLNAVSVTDNNRSSNREFICMNVLIKGENEPMNIQRILYPAAEASFERILAFTAIGRAPEWSPNNSDYPVSNGSNPEDRKRLYDTINGEDTVVLRMQNLCGIIRKGSNDEVKEVIKKIFKELEEGEYKGDKSFVW